MRTIVKFPVNRHHQHLLTERGHKAPDQIAEEIRVAQDGVGAFVRRDVFFCRFIRQVLRRLLVVHRR